MRQIIKYSFFAMALAAAWGCKKDTYPGATMSPYISIFDIRPLYKGTDVVLTPELMGGSDSIAGVVVSDFSGGNMIPDLLVMEDNRRLAKVRGISLNIGKAATSYNPGDSLVVNLKGTRLTRANGILQVVDITESNIRKVTTGAKIPSNRVTNDKVTANPDLYESTLSTVVNGSFDPLPTPADILSGDKTLNDGFGNITLHTEAGSSIAQTQAPVFANYSGIIFRTSNDSKSQQPQLRMRTAKDLQVLSSTITIVPVVITGFMSDPAGTDANFEYVQMMAAKDIDFSVTPYALVTTNNAGASTPTGTPANGWATGGLRTYKFNIASGKVSKGSFFYVGGTGKLINSTSSTDISAANWVGTMNYTSTPGNSFGAVTTNLLANSGNAFGMAVFADSAVTVNSVPADVIFISSGGTLYSDNPLQGYRITNTDFYYTKDPLSLKDQPYYRAGTNTLCFGYNADTDKGYFNILGGVYDTNLGRWTQARVQSFVMLSKQATLTDIEGAGSTVVK